MTDKESILFVLFSRGVPILQLFDEGEVFIFPFASRAVNRAARAAGSHINIIRSIGNSRFLSHLKFIHYHVQLVSFAILIQDLPDAAHTLVGHPIVKVQYGNFQPVFSRIHPAKIRNPPYPGDLPRLGFPPQTPFKNCDRIKSVTSSRLCLCSYTANCRSAPVPVSNIFAIWPIASRLPRSSTTSSTKSSNS